VSAKVVVVEEEEEGDAGLGERGLHGGIALGGTSTK
jgi:hypothetical protein